MTAIIGRSTLGQCIANKIPCDIFDRSHWDLSQPISHDLVNQLLMHDTIIVCAAINKGSTTQIFQINCMAPIDLVLELMARNYQGHVILLGSHGASWPSWPDIDMERLSYNHSKLSLREFIKGLAHSGRSPMKLTMFEPTKFCSPMSDYQGSDANDVADRLISNLHSDILQIELTK